MAPPSRDLLLAAAVVAGAALLQAPEVVPDGIEMAAAGRCLWTAALDAGACAGREPFFWQPAFPLLSGALALLLDPAVAAHSAAALVVGLLVLPLAALGRRLDVPAAGPIAAALVLATPALRQLVSLPSGRGLALLGLLGAAAVALSDRPAGRRGALVGALLVLAVLSRKESALPASLLGFAVLVRNPREGAATLAAGLAGVAPWLALVSFAADAPRLTGRGWEAAAYPWDAVAPHAWLLMELSMGSRGAPLRQAVAAAGGSSGSAALDLASLPGWLRYALPASVPLWLTVLGVGGVASLARTGAGRRALVGLVVLGAPPLALAVLPNAQEVVYPAQNLHPTVIAVLVAATAGAGAAARWLAARVPGVAVVGVLGAGLAAASAGNQAWVDRVVPAAEPDRILAAAAARLSDGAGPVAASIDTAPAAIRSGRPRRRLPSAWLAGPWLAGHPDGVTVLVTHRDLPAARRTLERLASEARIAPAWRIADGPAWATAWTVTPLQPPADEPDGG